MKSKSKIFQVQGSTLLCFRDMESITAEDEGKSKIFGWRTGLVTAAASTSLVLFINTVSATMLPRSWLQDRSITIYQEKCTTTRNLNIAAHIGINILGVAIISGSNYSMQVLNAPTRKEVNKAHSRWIWLDIGVASIRNLKCQPMEGDFVDMSLG